MNRKTTSAYFLTVGAIALSANLQASNPFNTGDVMVCNPGPGMTYENSVLGKRLNTWRPDGLFFVHFNKAAQPANVSQPKDGECAWKNRYFEENDPESIRMQARNTLKVINAFHDNRVFEVKVLPGSDSSAATVRPFLMMGWNGGSATIK